MENLFEDNRTPIIQIVNVDSYFDEPYKIYDSDFIIRKEDNMYYNREKVVDFHTKVFDNSKLARITTESNNMLYEVPMSDLDFKLHILDEK